MKKFTRVILFVLLLCVFAADALAESGITIRRVDDITTAMLFVLP